MNPNAPYRLTRTCPDAAGRVHYLHRGGGAWCAGNLWLVVSINPCKNHIVTCFWCVTGRAYDGWT